LKLPCRLERWGRGAHPAGLNIGDCLSEEVAKEHYEITKTDLASAL
jgi:uncharacterized protein with PIN domain